MKRIISVLTAIFVLFLFACPMCVSAVQDAPEFEVDSVTVAAGEEAKVEIAINNNPGIISAKLKVEFDSALTLKSVKFGDEIGGTTQTSQELKSPVTLNWIILETAPKNMDKDTVFATLLFSTENAKPGNYDVKLSYNPNDVYNADENNIKFETVDGAVNVMDTAAVAGSVDGVATTGVADDAEWEGGEEYPEGIVAEENAEDAAEEEEQGPNLNVLISVWIGITVVIIVAAFIAVYLKKKKDNSIG